MNVADAEKRIEVLEAQHEQATLKVVAIRGAIQDAQWFLDMLKLEAASLAADAEKRVAEAQALANGSSPTPKPL